MDILGWLLTGILLLTGIAGAVIPAVPGTAVIMGAAVLHFFTVGEDQSPGWPGYALLALLLVLSYVLEILAASAGAKKFGATKAGVWGALFGGFLGMFFGIPGLLLGPVVGAFLAETVIARQNLKASARASHGAFWGTIAGALIKLTCALLMTAVFLIDALWL